MRKETSYYPEIQTFIEQQLASNFRAAKHHDLHVYWGIGELKKNMLRIIRENPDICACMTSFADRLPPLDLDIFAVITDASNFELLILEVKRMNSVGLKEWSQLLGYCLVSGAKYGLLVNIDNGASERLSDILITEGHLSLIRTIIDSSYRNHYLGCMSWDSRTHDFIYNNLGYIKSLSQLSNILASEF